MTSFHARKDVKDIIEYFRDRVLKIGQTTVTELLKYPIKILLNIYLAFASDITMDDVARLFDVTI